MNAVIGALRVVLGLDSVSFEKGMGEAQKTLNKTAKNMQSVGSQMQQTGGMMSVALTAPLIAFGLIASKAATESGQAIGQVEARLRSMGSAAGFTKAQLAEMAGALEDTSLYDDDDILRTVTANLMTFGRVSGEQFKRAQQAAVDLSAALGQDLQSSTMQVGKALNDPVKGITALTKVGVSFTEQQKDQVAALVKTGDVAAAQGIILDELAKQFGGSAQQMRDDDPFAALQQTVRGLQEVVGEAINTAIKPAIEWAEKLVEGFNAMPPEMQTTIVTVGALVAALGPAAAVIGSVTTIIGGATAVLAASAPVLLAARGAWTAYMMSVALVGPVQATITAGSIAMGAAINFALGPIGLAVAAVGLLAAAYFSHNQELKASKQPTAEFTKQSVDLKKATDAYASAALAAASATGEEKKSLTETAAAAKQAAIQKRDSAQASLNAANASLAAASAARAERAAVFQDLSGDFSAMEMAARERTEELKLNKLQANIDQAKKDIDEATAAIAGADRILKAGSGGTDKPPVVLTNTKAAAKDAKSAVDDLKSSLDGVMGALATPDEAADKVFAERMRVLRAARQADLIDEQTYQEAIRRAREELRDTSGLSDVKPLELGKIDTKELETAVAKVPEIIRPMRDAFISLGEDIARSLGEAIVYGDDLGDTLARSLKRIQAEWLDSKISEIFAAMRGETPKGGAGSGGWAEGLGKAIGGLFGSSKSGGGSGGGGWLGNAMGSIFGGSKSGGGSGGGWMMNIGGLFGIGKNAQGTENWRGGLSWVGEDGPELLNIPSKSQIFNKAQLSGMMTGGGGGGMTVDLRGAVMTQDLLNQFNKISKSHAGAARKGAVSDAARAAPSVMANYNTLGTVKR